MAGPRRVSGGRFHAIGSRHDSTTRRAGAGRDRCGQALWRGGGADRCLAAGGQGRGCSADGGQRRGQIDIREDSDGGLAGGCGADSGAGGGTTSGLSRRRARLGADPGLSGAVADPRSFAARQPAPGEHACGGLSEVGRGFGGPGPAAGGGGGEPAFGHHAGGRSGAGLGGQAGCAAAGRDDGGLAGGSGAQCAAGGAGAGGQGHLGRLCLAPLCRDRRDSATARRSCGMAARLGRCRSSRGSRSRSSR